MPRHSWFDRLPRPESSAAVAGLVLSGGGARASFHIGALRYLYDVVGIAPTSIVGTSAGSIVGVMLAQSMDPAVQSDELRELERFWLSMTDSSDMFVEQAWFTRLRGHWEELSGLSGLLGTRDSDDAPAVVETGEDDPAEVVKRAMADDPSSGMTLSPADVWQLAGSLLRVGRAGAGLAASVRGAERAASAYRPGPIVNRLLFESTFRAGRVRQSGVKLRLAFVDLDSGELRYMREDGVIVDRDDKPIDDAEYDLALGVWASCAVPGIFRPVKLGSGVYVDGGVRENVPVEMAVDNLGATRPYVVVAVPPGVVSDDFATKDVVSVLLRVAAITLDETVHDEVEQARHAGACVIEPHIDVHDAWTVEPALLRINRDYGWTRAAEEVTEAPPSLREVDEAICRARCDWAALVRPASPFGGVVKPVPAPPKPKQIAAIQTRLRGLLARADDVLLPPGHEKWADALM